MSYPRSGHRGDPLQRQPLDIPSFESNLEAYLNASSSSRTSNGVTPAYSSCECTFTNLPPLFPVQQSSATAGVNEITSVSHLDSNQAVASAVCIPSDPRAFPALPNTISHLLDTLSTPDSTAGEALTASESAGEAGRVRAKVQLELVIYACDTGAASVQLAIDTCETLEVLMRAIPCPSKDTDSGDADTFIGRCEVSLLFVEDTLYELTERPNSPMGASYQAADYATPIVDFLRENAPADDHTNIPKVKRFSNTDRDDIGIPKVRDLRPRLGRPYVYIHDGDCEHRVIFTDLRGGEAPGLGCGEGSCCNSGGREGSTWVSVLWKAAPSVRGCRVCGARAATTCVFGDPISDTSPVDYCSKCYQRANSGLRMGEKEEDIPLERTRLVKIDVGHKQR